MTKAAGTMGAPTMEPDDPTTRAELPPPVPPVPPPAQRWWEVPVARDQDGGKIGGVVAGLCRAFGFDLTTTRIAVVIASLVVPAVLVLYVAAWILLPPRAQDAASLRDVVGDRRRLPLMIALGLAVALGGFGSFGSWTVFGGFPWGLALIVIGVLLWMSPKLGPPASRPDTTASPDTPGTIPPPPPPGVVKVATSTSAPPPPSARRGYPIGTIALLLSLLTLTVASVGDALGWWEVQVLAVVFVALAILILGVIASAIVNRSWAPIGALIPLLLAGAALGVLQPNLDGGLGDREVRPTSLEDGHLHEQLAAGDLRIDLTSIPPGSSEVSVDAELGFGDLEVIVPPDVVVDLTTRVGAGRVILDGDTIVTGVRQSDQRLVEPAAAGSAGGDRRTIVLDLEIGGGEIEVHRLP